MRIAGTSPRLTARATPHTATPVRVLKSVILVGLALTAVGLLGLDARIYFDLSRTINTDDPLSGDPYQRAKPLWQLARVGIFALFFGFLWLRLVHHPRTWALPASAVFSTLFVAGVANILQSAIGRLRPNHTTQSYLEFHPPFAGWWDNLPDGLPSGEASFAFAMATALSLMNRRLAPLAFALATLTGAARALPGMHFLSDVALGAAFGTWGAWFMLPRVHASVQTWLQQRRGDSKPPAAPP
jgi:membrane-associated phospholipid phosphatase